MNARNNNISDYAKYFDGKFSIPDHLIPGHGLASGGGAQTLIGRVEPTTTRSLVTSGLPIRSAQFLF